MTNTITLRQTHECREVEKASNISQLLMLGFVIFMFVYFSLSIVGLKKQVDSQKYEYEMRMSNLSAEIQTVTNENIKLTEELNVLTMSNTELQNQYNSLLEEKMVQDSEIIEKYVPTGKGAPKTYMRYEQKWSKGSRQRTLHATVSNDVYYDDNGYAIYDNRYFVAVKPYYGSVGDYIDVYQKDGTIIPCIIGDIKGSENDNKYIHYDGSIVEFMVDRGFKGVKRTRPEFCQSITTIKNLGNYFNL